MSIQTRSPLRSVGAVNISGVVNDGSFLHNVGGQRAYSIFSGGLLTLGSGTASGINGGGPYSATAGGHLVVVSGPGRLNTMFIHQQPSAATTSILAYDTNQAGLSGVITAQASGSSVVGVVPGWTPVSGLPAPVYSAEKGGPFYNGLAIYAASGAPGVTVTYSVSNEGYTGP